MAFLILLLLFSAIATFFIFLFIQSYNTRNIITQWILFFPTSLLFTMLIGIIFGVIFIGFIPLKEIVFLPLSWTICPIIFFVTLNKTMPKGKYVATNILAGVWLLLRAYESFRLLTSELFPETFETYENTSSSWVVLLISSLVQIISLSFLLCVYNKKNKSVVSEKTE